MNPCDANGNGTSGAWNLIFVSGCMARLLSYIGQVIAPPNTDNMHTQSIINPISSVAMTRVFEIINFCTYN